MRQDFKSVEDALGYFTECAVATAEVTRGVAKWQQRLLSIADEMVKNCEFFQIQHAVDDDSLAELSKKAEAAKIPPIIFDDVQAAFVTFTEYAIWTAEYFQATKSISKREKERVLSIASVMAKTCRSFKISLKTVRDISKLRKVYMEFGLEELI